MATESWLLLIHQLRPKPPYLRVKVWRRLQALGAVPLKNSVYVLPDRAETREDFEWLVREIQKEAGDASLCEARIVDGLTDDEVRALFLRAREDDFRALGADVRRFVRESIPARARSLSDETRSLAEAALGRFRKRLAEVERIDFFTAPGREAVHGLLAGLEERIATRSGARDTGGSRRSVTAAEVQGRTWVTRRGIHIDRIACAWLIRRFIDPNATVKFVDARSHSPSPRELRFDMFDAEFTHEGDLCSFEVLLRAFGLSTPALCAVAEVVHDVDLKDSKFARDETAGIEHLIAGIAWLHPEDEKRAEHGAAVFDALHGYFQRRRSGGKVA